MKKVALTLELSSALDDEIEKLKSELRTSKTGVIRRAIVLMRLAHAMTRDGYVLGFVKHEDADKLDLQITGI